MCNPFGGGAPSSSPAPLVQPVKAEVKPMEPKPAPVEQAAKKADAGTIKMPSQSGGGDSANTMLTGPIGAPVPSALLGRNTLLGA